MLRRLLSCLAIACSIASGTATAAESSSAPDAAHAKTEVRLDVKRGAVAVGIAWPEKSLGELAGFVRELLK